MPLTFTQTNYATPQTVTVTAVSDDLDAGQRTATISHTVGATGGYDNVTASSVTVILTNTNKAGVRVKPTLTVDENGTNTYTVTLNSKPTANVTVRPATSATAPATVSPASLIFIAANWDTSQTVTVAGKNNNTSSPTPQTATVSHTTTSTDGKYNNLSAPDIAVRVAEDDPGISLSKSVLTVAENAGVQTYTVRLNSEPSANVTVTPASSVSGTLKFTPHLADLHPRPTTAGR